MSTDRHEECEEIIEKLLDKLAEARRRDEEAVSLPWQWPSTHAGDTARAVRMARAWCGWTQREMARALGVRQETVSSWEKGRSVPLRRSWEGMVEGMGVPLARLSSWVVGKP